MRFKMFLSVLVSSSLIFSSFSVSAEETVFIIDDVSGGIDYWDDQDADAVDEVLLDPYDSNNDLVLEDVFGDGSAVEDMNESTLPAEEYLDIESIQDEETDYFADGLIIDMDEESALLNGVDTGMEGWFVTEDSGDAGLADDFGFFSTTPLYSAFASGSVDAGTYYADQIMYPEAKGLYHALVKGWSTGGNSKVSYAFSEPLTCEVNGTWNGNSFSWSAADKSSNQDYLSNVELIKSYIQVSMEALLYDHPEVYWFKNLSFSWSYSMHQTSATTARMEIHTLYVSGNERYSGAISEISSFRSSLSSSAAAVRNAVSGYSDAKKARYIHDYICERSVYEENTYAHVATGFFLHNGYIVCEGYAKAFKLLCDNIGLPCICVVGEVGGVAHMWNYVLLDDGWFLVDTTFDDRKDGTYNFNYLLAGSDDIRDGRSLYSRFSTSAYTQDFSFPALQTDTYHEWSVISQEDDCNYIYTDLICEVCDDERSETDLSEHAFGEWSKPERVSCDDKALIDRICSKCQYTESMWAPVGNHEAGDWTVEKEASCTEAGLRKKNCTVCGDLLETEEIPVLEHSYGEWSVVKEATCISDGERARTCGMCADVQAEAYSDPDNHDTGDWIIETENTCTSDGLKVKKCLRCDKVMESEALPMTGHSFGFWKTEKDASCLESGLMTRTCQACNEVERATLSAFGHTKGMWTVIKEATCKETGREKICCIECGAVIQEREIPILSVHAYGDWKVKTPSSCLTDGLKERICSCCGKTEQEVIKAAGFHAAGTWVETEKPTCVKQGTLTQSCSVCGTVLTTKKESVLSHSYGTWKIEKTATCTDDGLKTRNCSVCGTAESQTVKSAGSHTPGGWAVKKKASCTEQGVRIQKCTACGKELSSEKIPATGHNFTAWNTTKTPSTESAGERSRSCRNCNLTEKESVAKLTAGTPSTPKTVTAEVRSYNTIEVQWSEVSNISGYIVYRKSDGGSWTLANKTSSVRFLDSSAVPGVKYCYKVCSYKDTAKGSLISDYSKESTAVSTVLGTATITGTLNGKNAVLSWNKVPGASGYQVLVKDGSSWKHVKYTLTTGFTYKGMPYGKTLFSVRAYSKNGSEKLMGGYSNSAEVTRRPAKVTLSSVRKSDSGISVKWKKISGVSGYEIYRKKGNGSFTKIKTVNSKTISFVDKNVKSGTTYSYYIKAYVKSDGATYRSAKGNVKKIKK